MITSFSSKLQSYVKSLTPETINLSCCDQIEQFYKFLLAGNQVQNLTRLIEPEAFIQGHLVDVVELIRSQQVSYPAMDLGSGAGVPGLLAGMITKDPWILAESEVRKADFLDKTVKELDLSAQFQVFGLRAEEILKHHRVETIVARAVGPVDRIYGWIRKCSTWNKLVLLKGPSWDEEWTSFQESKYGHELELVARHGYSVGPEKKTRLIVSLTRKR